jgi:hypothetical protein
MAHAWHEYWLSLHGIFLFSLTGSSSCAVRGEGLCRANRGPYTYCTYYRQPCQKPGPVPLTKLAKESRSHLCRPQTRCWLAESTKLALQNAGVLLVVLWVEGVTAVLERRSGALSGLFVQGAAQLRPYMTRYLFIREQNPRPLGILLGIKI